MVSRTTTPAPLFPTAPIRPAPLQAGDGARHRRLNIGVEVRPVDAVNRYQLASAATRCRNGSDLAASSLDVDVLGFGRDLSSALAVAARRNSGGGANQRLISSLVVVIGAVVPSLAAKPAGYQRALGPAVGDTGEMPLDAVGLHIAVELVTQVDEGLGGRDVEVVDTCEVEDDGAQDGARGNLVVVGDLAATRARVIPRAVLPCVRALKSRVRFKSGGYLHQASRTC